MIWRLPIGRPDAMVPPADTSYVPAAASVSGCEPPSHSAQRLITQITGYRCTHLHPLVDSTHNACAYIGPQMVEPLALQIEQRTSPVTTDDLTDEDDHQPRTQCQYVMTCYYMAWLTQSRFEQRAATLPVGPANGLSARQSMPMAEVTWFKMDTAAQVLSHASDKLALREAIHRMTRGDVPRQPFTYSSILKAPTPVQAEAPEITEEVAVNSDVASSAESSAGFSDAATKTGTTVTPSRVVSPSGVRNLDILRKTATSLSKRGGLLIRSGRNSTAKDEESDDNAKRSPPATASMPLVTANQAAAAAAAARPASTPQDLVVRTKPHFPRVLSIFYKLVGSSS
ncbi:hypothetical protein GGI14_003076 [Coemansia sp. S680]|nr:hypothetical protein GGI14_003076 [Coemansia sp. S680]